MRVLPTALPDVRVVEPDVHRDARGFFLETWRRDRFAAAGIGDEFVQDNHSRSVRGTLRGLHYQITEPQGKLVRVARGEVFDVAVDLRRSSPTFGRWVGERLSEEAPRALWIPPGFAHGFYVLSAIADLEYKCTAPWRAEYDRAIRWDDPRIGIDWPLDGASPPQLSAKDASAPLLADAECYP